MQQLEGVAIDGASSGTMLTFYERPLASAQLSAVEMPEEFLGHCWIDHEKCLHRHLGVSTIADASASRQRREHAGRAVTK